MLEFGWLCLLLIIGLVPRQINQFEECGPGLEKISFTFPLVK